MFCDLHMHSTASDGTDAPRALGALAAAAGVSAIALTDHDTTAGLDEASEGCREAGVAFVPGIEVSADPGAVKPVDDDGRPRQSGTLHILGLFVDARNEALLEISRQMQRARDQRNPAIVAKLQELGVNISYDEVLALAAKEGTASVGRPHIGQVLIAKGYVKSMQDAFNRYIGSRGAAYVRRDRLHPQNAIEAIHHAGGVAVLAHPVQLGCGSDDELEYVLRRLIDLGLDAMETRHSDHTPALVQKYEALAAKLALTPSGGSDYHGTRKTVALGSQRVPMNVYAALKAAAERRV